ncbi:MAG: SDR family NAD(P)-dependent oxidoreductase [Bacteroidia bacterium]|nr:SDR family NAD(P)-dependent oxidoreductase [Bacteroidia bacterium]
MKIALVTGAYKGLGFEWCRQLGKLGYKVLLTARKTENAIESANILIAEGLEIYPIVMEVTDHAQIGEVVRWVEEKFGKLDLLINNAGINSGTRARGNKELQNKNLSLESLEPNEVLNMININAIAPIIVARHFRYLLAKSESGKIINIGSWLGSISIKKSGGNYSYAVSKSALNMMNKALAYDLAEDNIISVVVNPGWVQTDMGGGKAQFTTEQSVLNLIENVVNKIELNDSGKFLNFDGTEHPW